MTPEEGRHLRTDAERNRSRIIEAATAAFARRGLDVQVPTLLVASDADQAPPPQPDPLQHVRLALFAAVTLDFLDGQSGAS